MDLLKRIGIGLNKKIWLYLHWKKDLFGYVLKQDVFQIHLIQRLICKYIDLRFIFHEELLMGFILIIRYGFAFNEKIFNQRFRSFIQF